MLVGKSQVQLRNDNKFMIGYKTPTTLTLGTGLVNGVDNGQWAFESWDNGLNIYKPFPSTNWGNYKLFIDNSTGNVGIGKKPSGKLDVAGDIYTNGTLRISSDFRLKSNINQLSSNREKLLQLTGFSYNKQVNILDERKEKSVVYNDKIEFGFIAQELQKVYPELVYSDKDGFLSVDYISLIPVIIEAFKEQNTIINNQNIKINELEKKLSLNQTQKASIENINDNSSAVLKQNIPNPSSHTTEIGYVLPSNAKNATIYVFDMTGKPVKNYTLEITQEGKLIINSLEYSEGIYLYSLVVDNKEVDTKRMIITKN